MKEHADDASLTVSVLAEISGLSEKSFRRAFLQIYGIAPYEYLQKFRMEKAEILLLNTPMSISEIALLCGFSDIYGFSHALKRHLGISPSVFRKRH